MQACVYIMASLSGRLYTGVTSDLMRRVHQHRTDACPGFTRRHRVHRLVYYECARDMHVAIAREKQNKAWSRHKRITLIESFNPAWLDLTADWYATESAE